MSKSTTCLTIRRDTLEKLRGLVHDNPYLKLAEISAYAIDLFVDYFRTNGAIPKTYNLQLSHKGQALAQLSSDLPGLTAEVIQSHLVRFPKVTPEAYRGIIEELKRRQASEEGLKNPEASAYGLCKRIQSGHADVIEAAKKQEPTTTPSETDENGVPEDAFAYPPQF